MPDIVFEWNKLKIKVHEKTGRHIVDKGQLAWELGKEVAKHNGVNDVEKLPPVLSARVSIYTKLLTYSTFVKGKPGFKWPPNYEVASGAELYESFVDFWDKCPGNLYEAWDKAIDKSNLEIPDPNE